PGQGAPDPARPAVRHRPDQPARVGAVHAVGEPAAQRDRRAAPGHPSVPGGFRYRRARGGEAARPHHRAGPARRRRLTGGAGRGPQPGAAGPGVAATGPGHRRHGHLRGVPRSHRLPPRLLRDARGRRDRPVVRLGRGRLGRHRAGATARRGRLGPGQGGRAVRPRVRPPGAYGRRRHTVGDVARLRRRGRAREGCGGRARRAREHRALPARQDQGSHRARPERPRGAAVRPAGVPDPVVRQPVTATVARLDPHCRNPRQAGETTVPGQDCGGDVRGMPTDTTHSDLIAVDLTPLRDWLDAQGLGAGELTAVSPIGGGTQNVMIGFERSGVRYILRRGPQHLRPQSNRIMQREMTLLRALAGTSVPHPMFVAGCEDTDVIGAVFYLMRAVDGYNAAESLTPAHAADPGMRHRMGLSMVDALGELARLDPASIGLTDFGRPDGFLARQVDRWRSELESFTLLPGYPTVLLPEVDRIASWLED